MSLREQFEKETGCDESKIRNDIDRMYYDRNYIEWLEKKVETLQETVDCHEQSRKEAENILKGRE